MAGLRGLVMPFAEPIPALLREASMFASNGHSCFGNGHRGVLWSVVSWISGISRLVAYPRETGDFGREAVLKGDSSRPVR